MNCGLIKEENCKVWVYFGDGEMDELESIGVILFVGCEKLDNFIWVVNCNL